MVPSTCRLFPDPIDGMIIVDGEAYTDTVIDGRCALYCLTDNRKFTDWVLY